MKYLVDGVNCICLLFMELLIIWFVTFATVVSSSNFDYVASGSFSTIIIGGFIYILIDTFRETLGNKKLRIGQ